MGTDDLIPPGATRFLYEERGSSLEVWKIGADLFVTRIRGYGHVSFKAHLLVLDAAIAAGGKLRIFHDWEESSDYDHEIRGIFVGWTTRNLRHIGSITLLTRSSIVALGVTTGSLLLGSLGLEMRHFRDRTKFEAAIRKAMAVK